MLTFLPSTLDDPIFIEPGDPAFAPVDNGQGFGAIFGVVFVLALLGAVAGFAIKAMNASRIVESGHNPLTFETDLAIRAMESRAFAPDEAERPDKPEKTVAERLAELDALHAEGTISDTELEAARARVISDI